MKKALRSAEVVAFAATQDPSRSKIFYRDKLGLKLVSEDQFALVFICGGTTIRVAVVPKVVSGGYTILGWQVDDIAAAVAELVRAGIVFERYPGMDQDDLGVWTSPSGAKIAWFKDPDGNTLSLGEH